MDWVEAAVLWVQRRGGRKWAKQGETSSSRWVFAVKFAQQPSWGTLLCPLSPYCHEGVRGEGSDSLQTYHPPPPKPHFLSSYTSITAWSGLFQCLAAKRKESMLVDRVHEVRMVSNLAAAEIRNELNNWFRKVISHVIFFKWTQRMINTLHLLGTSKWLE